MRSDTLSSAYLCIKICVAYVVQSLLATITTFVALGAEPNAGARLADKPRTLPMEVNYDHYNYRSYFNGLYRL